MTLTDQLDQITTCAVDATYLGGDAQVVADRTLEVVAALRAALKVAEDIKDRSLVDGRVVALDLIEDIEKALGRPAAVTA